MAEVKEVGSLAEFRLLIESIDLLGVVHFWADWADQCQPVDDAIKILARDRKESHTEDVQFLRVHAETQADTSMEYEVAAVPTLLFFHAGKLLDRIEGVKVAEMTKRIKDLAADLPRLKDKARATSDTKSPEKTEKLPLQDRLKALINTAPAMLFMKGSPSAPECGFSRTTIQLLDGINAEYGYFDILRDQEVRQGLKEYSKWPTYPQLYLNGELLGGLDILKEMHEGGELESVLPKKKTLNEKLKFLINQSHIVVFMKGDRNGPRCGFSKQLMEIFTQLEQAGSKIPEMKTFDILKDEEVRQGLKTYSNWPTYPQVYVKGELIGGLDIIKELRESDELVSTLRG